MCLPVAGHVHKVESEWVHAGLKCAAVQARPGEHRCGYVRVPKTHAAFGRELDSWREADRAIDVDVHGGITFSRLEPCTHEDGRGFWFGFDCAHSGDIMYEPGNEPEWYKQFEREFAEEHPQYAGLHDNDRWWTLEDVVAETERLAEQLAQMANVLPPRSVRHAKRFLLERRPRRYRRELRRMSAELHAWTSKLKAA